MEKVYLDTILMATQIKNIHFMLVTLPLLNKLGDDYPLKKAHQKIKVYCNEKQIECLDLYEEGFKGLNATSLRVSITDRHLNETGSRIVAQTLYKRLSSLKTYSHLSKIHRAFKLKDLLYVDELSRKVDKEFDKLKNNGDILNFSEKNQSYSVQLENGNYIYKSLFKSESNNISTITSLSTSGEFFSWEKHITSGSKVKKSIQKLTRQKTGYHLENSSFNQNKNQRDDFPKRFTRKFILKATAKNLNSIKLEKNFFFTDPKVFEQTVFSNRYHISKLFTKEKKEFILKNIINREPKLKLKYSKTPFTEKFLNSKEIEELIDENIIFESFMNWLRYGSKNYADQLTEVISNKKPSAISLKATARYYSQINEYNKLNRLLKNNPQVFGNLMN
jgi:hypothetical protein